jgi:hypothetical protein
MSIKEYKKFRGTATHETQLQLLDGLFDQVSLATQLKSLPMFEGLASLFDKEIRKYNQFMVAEALGRRAAEIRKQVH